MTGAAALGGDWVLEAQTGDIATQTLVVSDYQASLAVTDIYVTVSGGQPIHFVEITDGSFPAGTWLVNATTTAGTGKTVVVKVTGLAADEQWSLYVDNANADTGSARTDTYSARVKVVVA